MLGVRMLPLVLLLAACGGKAASSGDDTKVAMDTGPADDRPDDVCGRWNYEQAYWATPEWEGDVDQCDAGSISSDTLHGMMAAINTYRWLAHLDPVRDDATLDANSQQCALMMRANGDVDNSPPTSWKCYSSEGAEAAGKGLVSQSPGAYAIDGFVAEDADTKSMGGRRWILGNRIDKVGVGTLDQYACVEVEATEPADGAPEWTAWPPSGQIPRNVAIQFEQSGWSIQSDTIDFSLSTMHVYDETGAELPMKRKTLEANYGSVSALAAIQNGWRIPVEGGKYHVVIQGGEGGGIEYDVEALDCRGQ